MKVKQKFENRISLAYLVIGGIWIIFSDKLLDAFIEDIDLLTKIQTFKGWFYVIVTAILFYLFLKKHLNTLRSTEEELELHQNNLEQLVEEKTKKLDAAIEELRATNEELNDKNEIINNQNLALKETVRQLKQTQAQLLQAEKMASLGVLTAGVAHEINNPLNFILGGITGLENYLKVEKNLGNEQTSLYIESIKTGIDRASSIVSELNQLSHTKAIFNEDCALHSIIENCLLFLTDHLKNNIRVQKKLAEGELFVCGNIGQLHQVFFNVLMNAVQSIKDKGLITITTTKKDELVSIEISDTGCGISQDHLSKIMDPFFTTKEPGQGTGLGLSIAYNIIHAHEGQIRILSEINRGTSVTIILPIKTYPNDESKGIICG
jgi:signal transduction histidine kinase